MNKKYKAVPFENAKKETRYRIIDAETGEVLDDAKGYGYKTARNAHISFCYTHRDKSKDEAKKAKQKQIKAWMTKHQEFVATMDQYALEIAMGSWGSGDKFDSKFVSRMLKEAGLAPDFTASELLRTWKNH